MEWIECAVWTGIERKDLLSRCLIDRMKLDDCYLADPVGKATIENSTNASVLAGLLRWLEIDRTMIEASAIVQLSLHTKVLSACEICAADQDRSLPESSVSNQTTFFFLLSKFKTYDGGIIPIDDV